MLNEELEFYQNKAGLLKHEANVEATKNIETMKLELEALTMKYERGLTKL